ncbi:response regulator transcription factor [Falsiroseomonas sp. CW058]|uniref:response regulator transcription factor n=1 Tax=Falsiroseomonas sp. CW058 TaxID=3388664 RepID=UPI003D316CAE
MSLSALDHRQAEIEGPERQVLIVEDDESLAEEMAITLTDYGLLARQAHSWDAALSAVATAEPDLIVLDQRLGRVDTLPRISELRGLTGVPIVVLTGNRVETDRIVALEIGADDFVLKPISGRELVARIRAHLRRATALSRPAVPPPLPAPPAASADQGWHLSRSGRELRRPDGSPVPLTAAEFDLLALLAELPGRPVDRDTLSQRVLRRGWRPDDRALDNLVMQLRRKVGEGGERMIAAVRSQGYAFTGFPRT